jgi:hypothetical protein
MGDEDWISTGSFDRPILDDDDNNFGLLKIGEVIDFRGVVEAVLKVAAELIVAVVRNRLWWTLGL